MADQRINAAEPTEVSQQLNALLKTCVGLLASDIHLEPGPESYRIRIRIDGRMQTLTEGDMHRHGQLMNRLKILCGMDITERRRPQDGGFSQDIDGRAVDFRVSVVPCADGEKAAIRILDNQSIDLNRESLGIDASNWEQLTRLIRVRHGLLIFTGPTGSGKTSTMYTLLKLLNEEHRHIITLEDPIEYRLPGINQIQVNERIDLDFASGLRAILRQDPEVILVGEIRDRQTAEIAVRAAITGHLVLTTLHTNDSHGAVTRLLDMGIESYLIAASVTGVFSQRLVRKLCRCKQKKVPAQQETLHYEKAGLPMPASLYAPTGCSDCHGGYLGRTAVTEVLPLTESLRSGILLREDASRLKQRTENFTRLLEDGLKKAAAGETTLEEVLDAVHE